MTVRDFLGLLWEAYARGRTIDGVTAQAADAEVERATKSDDVFEMWASLNRALSGVEQGPSVLRRLFESGAHVLDLFVDHRHAPTRSCAAAPTRRDLRVAIKRALLRFVNTLESADRALAGTAWARHVAFVEAMVRRGALEVNLEEE